MRWFLVLYILVTMACQEPLDSDPLVNADGWRLAEFHPSLWRESATPAGACDRAIGIDPVAGVDRLMVDLTDCPRRLWYR